MARLVTASCSACTVRSRAAESSARRRHSRIPSPTAAVGTTTISAVWAVREREHGGERADQGDADRQLAVRAVHHRAVHREDRGPETSRRHVMGQRYRGGEDDRARGDRIHPPDGERHRHQRNPG
jgi:hypothetical protein